MQALARSFLASVFLPGRALALGAAVSAVALGVPIYLRQSVGHPIDVSWLFGLNFVIVYGLQIAPILIYGLCALRGARPFPQCRPRVRFLCVIPAYNEERVIDRPVRSLLAQEYPKDLYEVVVVSDGSTDRTDAIAQGLGARVLRTETGGMGKTRALSYAFDRLLDGPADDRYVCVVDADNRADPNLLQEMNNAICAGGFRCLQAFHDVLNGSVNWITKSLWITTIASSHLYNYGRFCGLGNALICGTGWCCDARLVQRYWPRIQTQTEDIELNGLLLLHEGIGVPWISAAHVYDEKPHNLWIAIRQRHRWMTGHMRAAGLLFWPCLREGLRRRDGRLVELAFYYLLPFVMNLSNVQVLLMLGIQAGLLTIHGPLATPLVQWCVNGVTVLYLFGYQVAGFAWETGRWRQGALYSIYAAVAGFFLWTPALIWACFTVCRKDWIFHTPHAVEEVQPSPLAAAFWRRGRGTSISAMKAARLALLHAAVVTVLLGLLPVPGVGFGASSFSSMAAAAEAPRDVGAGQHGTGLAAPMPPGDSAVEAAAASILAGSYPRAITFLEPLVHSEPEDLEARGLLALALYMNGQRLQADLQAYALRQRDPVGRETAFLVSRHLLSAFQQNTPVAEQLVKLLARQGGAERFLWLAQIYQDRGFYADALLILTRGVALYPTSAGLLDALGFNAWKGGLPATAIKAYQQAIRLAPNSWGLYFNLGWVYFTARRYADAAAAWRKALRLHPSDPTLPELIRQAASQGHPQRWRRHPLHAFRPAPGIAPVPRANNRAHGRITCRAQVNATRPACQGTRGGPGSRWRASGRRRAAPLEHRECSTCTRRRFLQGEDRPSAPGVRPRRRG